MELQGEIDMTVLEKQLDVIILRLFNADQIVEKYADKICGDAIRYAPVRTGRLMESIHVVDPGIQMARDVMAGEGLPDKRAIYMEYGTATISPRSYLRPAVEGWIGQFQDEINAIFSGESPFSMTGEP